MLDNLQISASLLSSLVAAPPSGAEGEKAVPLTVMTLMESLDLTVRRAFPA